MEPTPVMELSTDRQWQVEAQRMLKIAKQVEFYFSDANITKDKFLLKHVKRNK